MEKFNEGKKNPHAMPVLTCLSILYFLIALTTPTWGNLKFDEDSSESLLALPYIQYVKTEPTPNKTGTTIYKRNKAYPGYNIYASYWNSEAFVDLIDMNGNIIHRWESKEKELKVTKNSWKTAIPLANGAVFIMNEGWQLIDANSRIINTYKIPGRLAHHAAYYLKDGGFLCLVENQTYTAFRNLTLPILNESLVHIANNGQVKKDISLNQLFKNDPAYKERLEKFFQLFKKRALKNASKRAFTFDMFHSNNIENLEWDIPGIAKKGNWLITIRKLDRIIIIDPEKERIVWEWGKGIISMPHHATFLKGNKILLFDNGVSKKSSRVIILDIKSRKIIWQYGQKDGQRFFSFSRGSAQQLPNGNILIADSLAGRAFEVTSSGEIVWEWYTTFYTKGKYKGKRRTLYRIQRIPYEFFKNIKFNYGKISPETKKP